MAKKPQGPPRVAAIYCRVSTAGQEAEGTSLGTQEAACRAYAAERGYAVAEGHVYRETFSGADLWERPQLSKLRAAVRGGEVKAIIAHSLDRLSRSQAHIFILDDECARSGVAMLFATETFDKTPVGKMILSVKTFAAEIEREKIRERSVRGKRALAESGKLHNSGIDLYGYRRDRATRTRTIEESEAAVVRHIFSWLAKEGLTIHAIVARLNGDGIPPPAAGKLRIAPWEDGTPRVPRWGKSQVHRMLRNPAYKGAAHAWRHRYTKGVGTRERPPEEWIPLDAATTPAIVGPELWQAAQDRLDTNTGAEARNQKRRYLLRGHIVCAICGLRMYPTTERGGVRVYRCSSPFRVRGKCGGARVPADKIEARVWSEIKAAIQNPDRIYAQWQAAREAGPDPAIVADREAAARSLERITRQQERLVRRLRATEDDDLADIIEREIAQGERERKGLRAALDHLDAQLAAGQETIVALGTLVDYCARVAENLADFDLDHQRLALVAFNVRVEANSSDERQWQLRGSVPLGDAAVVESPSRA